MKIKGSMRSEHGGSTRTRRHLAAAGLLVSGTVDVKCRLIYHLTALPYKGAIYTWLHVYQPLIQREGLPDKWTFDRGSENWVVAFGIQLLVNLCYVNAATTVMAVVAIVGSKRQCRIERFCEQLADSSPRPLTCSVLKPTAL